MRSGGTRVAPPTWKSRTNFGGDSREAFRELTSLKEDGKPIFLYLTSSDEDMAQKIETYENSILVNEKVCIAAKFFDCFQVDLYELEDDHPILTLIKKPKPLTFYTIHQGKVLYKTKEKPSASQIFSTCSRTLKKCFSASLDKIVAREEKILDELDEILFEKERIEQTRLKKGKDLSEKEDAALQKKEQELFEREMTLKEEEQKLLNLEEFKKDSKETVKA